MLASWREPWWKAVLAGFVLTLVLLATGVWQLTVLSGAVAGFLAGRGRRGAIRGIQSTAPAWILWLLVLSLIWPVEDLVLILGGILGAGWGLVVLLFALIPVATTIPSLAALAGIDVLLWAMIAYETANYDERRYRLRHGLDPDPEAPLGGESAS